MENKSLVIVVAVAVIIIAIIAVLSMVSLDQTLKENETSQQKISQEQAEQLALDANYDWVLELNSLGRHELWDSNLQETIWVIRVRNYQRPEDQIGYLLLYRVNAFTGEVEINPVREEI